MSYSYEYDHSGLASSYLALSLILPLCIYLTYKSLYTKKKKKITCSCEMCKKAHKNRVNPIKCITFLLWVIISYLVYNIKTLKIEVKKGFDPLEVLGIEIGTSKKDIKRKLRNLLVKYNPEHADEKTRKECEEKMTLVNKAYNIVKSDEKFEKWLNSESKSGEIMAIPDFIMKKAYSAFGVYCFVLVVILPFYGIKKWKSIKEVNKLGVNFGTMEIFYKNISNKKVGIRGLISLMSQSVEFSNFTWNSDFSGLKDLIESDFGYPVESQNKKEENSYRAYLCILDYLFRTKKTSKTDSEYTQRILLRLVEGLKVLSISKGNVEVLKTLFILQSMIVQAVFDEEYYLLQYPGVKFNDLFLLKDGKNKEVLQNTLQSILSPEEYSIAARVEENIPRIEISELVATVKNTGGLDEEVSDVEDKVDSELILDSDIKNVLSTYKIERGVFVTVKLILRRSSPKRLLHAPYLREEADFKWCVFITLDNVLMKYVPVFDDFSGTKTLIYEFEAPQNKKMSEVKAHVECGYYMKNNTEQSIILKYY